jgi:hypothetical protein
VLGRDLLGQLLRIHREVLIRRLEVSTESDERRRGADPPEHRSPVGVQPDREVLGRLPVDELGWSDRKAARHTGVPRRTVPNVLKRKALYLSEEPADEDVDLEAA